MKHRKKSRTDLNDAEFKWLGDLQQALSPYWSARLTYQKSGSVSYPTISLEGLKDQTDQAHAS